VLRYRFPASDHPSFQLPPGLAAFCEVGSTHNYPCPRTCSLWNLARHKCTCRHAIYVPASSCTHVHTLLHTLHMCACSCLACLSCSSSGAGCYYPFRRHHRPGQPSHGHLHFSLPCLHERMGAVRLPAALSLTTRMIQGCVSMPVRLLVEVPVCDYLRTCMPALVLAVVEICALWLSGQHKLRHGMFFSHGLTFHAPTHTRSLTHARTATSQGAVGGFVARTVCVVSRLPLYGQFRAFLAFLLDLVTRRPDVPLESVVAHAIFGIPTLQPVRWSCVFAYCLPAYVPACVCACLRV